MKKKYIIAFFVILIIFLFIAYKNKNLGNNNNSSDKVNILNISSYDAVVEIEVFSNKNKNKYLIHQQYIKPNIFKQEIIEPENFKGLTTTFDGTNLIIENSNLGLNMLYEKYDCFQGNSLSLIRFLEELKENKDYKMEDKEEEIIITIKTEGKNKYEAYKKMYINKKNNLPTKMEIIDINQNVTVYILYKEININETRINDVLVK